MMQSLPSSPTFELQTAPESTHTVRGLQKKYPREGNSLFSSWGRKKVLRKQMKSAFMGRKHLSSHPQIQKVTWDKYAHAFWVPRGPGREIHGCVKLKFLRVVLQSHPWLPHAILHFNLHSRLREEGGEYMHKSHNFMRVDVSLPPGIMRDRALAERDFVTFPAILFFSVFSNRCRAMWEVGSLDGFEVLSVLSTHSLRPFIWSKCSEKLPTVQRRRNKHIQGEVGEGGGGGNREKDGPTAGETSMWLLSPDVPGWMWKTTGWRAMLWRRKRWKSYPFRLHSPVHS